MQNLLRIDYEKILLLTAFILWGDYRLNLSFEEMDVTQLLYKNKFDLVVSFWTLSWIRDQKTALLKMIESLKDTGRLFIMYPLRHDAYDVADEMIKMPRWEKSFQDFTSRSFVDKSTYFNFLESVNLDPQHAQHRTLRCVFKSKDEMFRSICSWLPYVDKISDEREKVEFVNMFIEGYQLRHAQDFYAMFFEVIIIDQIVCKLGLPHKM